MIQFLLGFIVISFFIFNLIKEKKAKKISSYQFYVWLFFWIFSLVVLMFLKKIDSLVLRLGFSSSGAQFIFYFAVIILFYSIFRMKIKIEKLEKNITKIVEKIAIKK
jgi:hypothetical protein